MHLRDVLKHHCCIAASAPCVAIARLRALQALARTERDLQLARRDVQMLRQERREAQQAQDRARALEKELAGLSGAQEELVKAEKVQGLLSTRVDTAATHARQFVSA